MGKPYIVCSVPNVGQCEILDSRVDGGENEPLIVARFWNHQLANRAAELLNAEVDQPPALTIAAEASAGEVKRLYGLNRAAPDLLAACKAMLEDSADIGIPAGHPLSLSRAMAIQAIAKAEATP